MSEEKENTHKTGYALDLEALPSQQERSKAWTQWVLATFPGLIVSKMTGDKTNALVRLAKVGAIRLHSIIQTSQIMMNKPDAITPSEQTVGFIIQKSGHSEIELNNRHIQLRKGTMGILDGGYEFTLESIGTSHTHVFTMPRGMALAKLPGLLESPVSVIQADEPLLDYISFIIEHSFEHQSLLSNKQTTVWASALMSLLEGVNIPSSPDAMQVHWRVKRGLSEINTKAHDENLTAEDIAIEQNISRRRLDKLFLEEIGSTISFQISEKRLTAAAAALCDPGNLKKNITTIAYDCGYKDGAHFSRAFKLKFGISPKAWRRQTLNEQK
ncbi:helix-turn-helix domain-containing protein [Gynuella sunshinyii]|uniref:AraC-type DNA-binding domain-containing protein n=1 Tax=Gynuella sunshinyii YC6258 TaxID=1445510 RepID=A0A0C5VQC9_9GAMM|nr:helix-turn-helix domain-containing protein [Gynuella sunshinyii]AJQ95633.1 araC-type DNA-binding domain-containing protein [Gynuella sunshinyii YC6258]